MKQKIYKKIMLSFDIEFWHDEGWLSEYMTEEPKEDFIEESLSQVLTSLAKYNAKATFFITGKIIEKYPYLLKEIAEKGHEIASHGYTHQPLDKLGAQRFGVEIQKAVAGIEKTTGKKPKGFRAPSFSLSNKTKWALPILAAHGFKYDSSIFPVPVHRYGVAEVPEKEYRISFDDVAQIDPESPILEIPVAFSSILSFRIPIAGGVYFRLLPYWIFSGMLRSVQKQRHAALYFHLYELYNKTPTIRGAPWVKRAVKYYNVKNNFNRFEKLLRSFQCDSIENVMGFNKVI